MEQSLSDLFKQIPDTRRAAGRRHDLSFCLTIIVLGIMSGHVSLRGVADFAFANRIILGKYFTILCDRIPSYSTIRRILFIVDLSSLQDLFNKWALRYIEADTLAGGNVYAIDGKVNRSTVVESNSKEQDFISSVSVFSHYYKQVIASKEFENKQGSEIQTAFDLLDIVEVHGKTITMDALHCQKKL